MLHFSRETSLKMFDSIFEDERFKGRNKEKISRFIYKMAELGWFTEHFTEISNKTIDNLFGLLYSNQFDKIDDYYLAHFENKFTLIQKELIERYPNREPILKEAFSNTLNKNYSSSIVLLLTQIDGICNDNYGVNFFITDKKNNYKPKVEPKINENLLGQHKFALSPISKKTPINIHQSGTDNFPIELNRHNIIHGLDTTYGSKLNNYKVLSTLSYLDKLIQLNLISLM